MASSIERLESRRLLAAALDGNGTLTVVGTYRDDAITVAGGSHNGAPAVFVRINREITIFAIDIVTAVRVHGRRGDDFIQMHGGLPGGIPIRMSGEGGDDFFEAPAQAVRMYGNSGNDTIRGHFGADTIFGGAGDDLLGGRFNRDKVYGEDGNDTLYGSEAADQLDGGVGNDLLKGDAGRDVLRDTAGQNTLLGGDGDDRLFNGLSATGTMTGGAGADRFSDAGDASDFLANEDDPDPLPDPLA